MCIAIYSKAGGDLLPAEWFNQSMRSHPDGMGLVYIGNDGQFKVIKSLHRGDVVYNAYRSAHRLGKDCLLHFRKATHGDVSVENCHPFYNGEDEVFIHNGVFRFVDQPDNTVDSALLGERILSHLPSNWRDLPDIVRMIEKWIDWSKVVILRRDGLVTILNESSGHWEKDKGLWFSNTSFRPPWRPNTHSKDKGQKKDKKKNNRTYDCAYNLPVKYTDRRSVRDDNGFGWSDHWGIEWWNRQDEAKTKQETLELDDPVTKRERVDDDSPWAYYFPDGYDYQGYEVCTYCIPMEWVDAPSCYPLFFDAERGFTSFECCSCTCLVTAGSTKLETMAFDRDTLMPIPESIENLEDEEDTKDYDVTLEYGSY